MDYFIIGVDNGDAKIISLATKEGKRLLLDALLGGNVVSKEEEEEEEIVKPKKVKKIKSLKYILGKGIEPVSCPTCNRVTKFPVDIAIEEGLRPTEILLGCGCPESYKLEIVKEK